MRSSSSVLVQSLLERQSEASWGGKKVREDQVFQISQKIMDGVSREEKNQRKENCSSFSQKSRYLCGCVFMLNWVFSPNGDRFILE